MKTLYRAPWDLKLILITSLLLILLVGLWYLHQGLIPTIITWSIIIGCAAFGVYGYSIQDGKLLVLRLGWSTEFDLSELKKAEVKPNAMLGSIRTFGIGGLFGYIGRFRNSVLGHYKAYATNSDKTVLLQVGNENVVVTPDDPDEFAEAVQSAA